MHVDCCLGGCNLACKHLAKNERIISLLLMWAQVVMLLMSMVCLMPVNPLQLFSCLSFSMSQMEVQKAQCVDDQSVLYRVSKIHCVSEKNVICDNLVKCHPILPILSRNIILGMKQTHRQSPSHLVLYVRTLPCKNWEWFFSILYSIRYEVSIWKSSCWIR